MSHLKSGVYFVKFKDINKFFQDAEANGWKHRFGQPQEEIHNTMLNSTRDSNVYGETLSDMGHHG